MSIKRHAGGEQGRKHQDRPDRKPCEACVGRDPEEADLGRRVEAEAEQDAERIHLPASLDQPEEPAEEAAEQTAVGEHEIEVFLDEPAAALDRRGTCGRSRSSTSMLAIAMANRNSAETRVPITPPTLLKASKRSCRVAVAAMAIDGQRDDDRRVAEREEQSDRDRPPALLHQLARHIVDGRDVVRVEGVPRARNCRRARPCRAAAENCGKRRSPRAMRPRVDDEQEDVDPDHFAPDILLLVVE